MTTKSKPRQKRGGALPGGESPAGAGPRPRKAPPAPRGGKPSAAPRPRAKKGRGAPPAPEARERDAQHPEASAQPEGVDRDLAAAEVVAEPEVLPPEGPLGEASAADLDPASSTLPVPVGRDLSRADVLQRYLADVSRHPLLTREEEHDLAVRFQQTRDPGLAFRLVTANLRLVVKIAYEYRRAAFNVLDLIQEGNVGLMQAVQKYDPFRGVKLSSYAAWWIRAYIIRYLMDNWRMVKLGTTQAQRKLFFNLRKEQEKLLSQGFEAQPKLLAERLDVSEQDVREMDQRLGNDELSLDTPMHGADGESSQTFGDRLGDGAPDAEAALGEEELRRTFKEKLAEFGRTLTSDKDRFLFEHRIAVPEGTEPLTLQQVGEKYGFTRERARQLEARLTDRLREFLRERMPDFAQLSIASSDED